MSRSSSIIIILVSASVISIAGLCYVIWDRLDQTDEIQEAHQKLMEAIEKSNQIIEKKNAEINKYPVDTFDFSTIKPLDFAETGSINVNDSVSLQVMIAAYDSMEIEKLKRNH